MSHVSQYKIKVGDLDCLKKVLEEKGIEYRDEEGTKAKQYGSNRIPCALAFKLPGWGYECAVQEDGQISYDHFGSQPNTKHLLGETIRDSNKEAVMEKVWMLGKNWWEEKVDNGLKIVIEF